MAGIASKNLYDLLGNDPEQDPDREPEPPTKAIDKPVARTGKRSGPSEAPAKAAGFQAGRPARDSHNANENAFRDSGVGADKNRTRGTGEEGNYRGRGDGRGRGSRGGRGGRGGPRGAGGDRHSRTGIAEHEKQAAHGWGGTTGPDEFNDEKAGEAIAKAEEAEDGAIANEPDSIKEAAEPEPEPEEDKTKSYTAYLAELAEKKLSLATAAIRKPNEGNSKKFPEGKPLSRQEEEEFISGSGGKAKRERERKQKEVLQLDDSRINQGARDSLGRGGGRGGRGRGEFRGGEGRGRGGRGRGEGRGRGGGERGSRGGQSGSGGPNVLDSSAFPSLGS